MRERKEGRKEESVTLNRFFSFSSFFIVVYYLVLYFFN